MNAYDFQFRTIDGDPLPFANFTGKAVLVVNTASYCGLTPQYAGLQVLYRSYRDRGLVVLGVPCNDFGRQEPDGEPEIKLFCTTRYDIEFPLTAKEPVIGPYAHPFYRWVADELGEDAAPKWNFHKYLIGRDGELAGTYGSRVSPEAQDLIAGIEEALGA